MNADGWPGIWPTLVMFGTWVGIVGAIIVLLGGIAAIVHNEQLADLLVFKIGPPPSALGTVAFFLGFGGWWTVLVVGLVVGFGWLVRRPNGVRPN